MAAADGPQTTKLMVARGDEVERDGAVYKVLGSPTVWSRRVLHSSCAATKSLQKLLILGQQRCPVHQNLV